MSNTSLLGAYGDNSGSALMFRNRTINGDMRIDQRWAGANVSLVGTETFVTDRFTVARQGGTATLSTLRQVTTISGATNFEANSAPPGFTHSLKIQIGTAGVSSTANETEIKHQLEGFNGADWGWGTAEAKPVTLSFWVKSSLTGNFGVGMRSATFNYSNVCSYTINTANTWEYKTITINPPTTGTFHADHRLHHTLYWDLGVGSTYSTTTLNTWQATDLRGGLTGGVKLAENAGATFYITGIQLETGTTATAFERRAIGTEEQLCFRYFYSTKYNDVSGRSALGLAVTTTRVDFILYLPTDMRVAPLAGLGNIAGWQVSDGNVGTAINGFQNLNTTATKRTATFYVTTGTAITQFRPYFFECSGSPPKQIEIYAEI